MTMRFRMLAAEQLEDFVEYYESLGSGIRRKFQRAVELGLGNIEQSPLSYAKIDERTRVYIIRPFKIGIFFEVSGNIVQISSLVDLRSDWQSAVENLN